MPESDDLRLGRLALEKGLIRRGDLERGIEEQLRTGGRDLGEVLRKMGLLPGDSLAFLRRECAACDTPPTLPAPASPIELEVKEKSGDPKNRFERYTLLGELGRGGMGIVFRAWDPSLRRVVAIKSILEAGDEQIARRLEREARTAARLSHPNIVPIFEVGDHEGRPFLAMKYIDGKSLNHLELGRREALEAVRDAARTVHFAHESGVIHRDLKPHNLMRDEEGRFWVMDFGVAREMRGGATLTASGTIVGTPGYMPPEQVMGEACDARSDVYALGATLYHLRTGRLPFEATAPMEILRQVCLQEPVPPRRHNPRMTLDEETIILKCMEKSPARRYATAEELAADLQRCLEGEPIRARRISTGARLWRKAVKHKAVLLPTTVAVALAVTFGIWFGLQQWRKAADLREGLARVDRLETEARSDRRLEKKKLEEARAVLAGLEKDDPEVRTRAERIAGRLGDIARAERLERDRLEGERRKADEALRKSRRVTAVLQRWTRIEASLRWREAFFYDSGVSESDRKIASGRPWDELDRFIRETPADDTSQAAMKALAGWAKRLGGHADAGLRWMRESSKLDPDLPYGWLMEALVLLGDYLRLQPRMSSAEGPSGMVLARAPGETKDMSRIRTRMEDLLARAERASVWGSDTVSPFRAVVEAMGALHRGKAAEAEAALTRAAASEEMRPFESGLLFARAWARYLQRKFGEASDDMEKVRRARPRQAEVYHFIGTIQTGAAAMPGTRSDRFLEEAKAAYRKALSFHPKDVEALNDLGNAYLLHAVRSRERGKRSAALLEEAIATYSRALTIDPKYTVPHTNRGRAFLRRGEEEVRYGGDGSASFGKAMKDLETVLRTRPDDLLARVNRGTVYVAMGQAARRRGEDPREWFRKAKADLDRALELLPSFGAVHMNRALVFELLGAWEADRGQDPTGSWERALADYREAVRLDVRLYTARTNRADLYLKIGDRERQRGRDPRASYEKAVADCTEVLRLDSGMAEALITRGNVRLRWGEWLESRGEDAEELLRSAKADYTAAIGAKEGAGKAYNGRGLVYLWEARRAETRGSDPRPLLRRAISDWEEALRLNPRHINARTNLGMAHWRVGEAEARRGKDPRPAFDLAILEYGRALEIQPGFAIAHNNRGIVYYMRGVEEARRGRPPDGFLRKAVADCDEVLRRNRAFAPAYVNRGNAYWRIAEQEQARGEDPRPTSGKAIADFEAAIRLKPDMVQAYANRGGVFMFRGDVELAAKREPASWFAKAETDFGKAVSLNPRHWQAHANLGLLYEKMGRLRDAIESFRAALKILPGHPGLKAQVERLERKAKPSVAPKQ